VRNGEKDDGRNAGAPSPRPYGKRVRVRGGADVARKGQQQSGRGTPHAPSIVPELRLRRVLTTLDILDHGLAAAHRLFLAVVGRGGRGVEVPALVQRLRHLVAEARVVGAGKKAVEPHSARPSELFGVTRTSCAGTSQRATPCGSRTKLIGSPP